MRYGYKIIRVSCALLILLAFAFIFRSGDAQAAYRYLDKIQPGVSTMEEVENEFGPPIESINTTTFKYDAPVQGLEAYVVEYSGDADGTEAKVQRLDIYLSNPIGSKNMAQGLGVSEPDLGAVNSEGKYEEFFGDVYSVIFVHESDSPDSGVVIVSFLTEEEFASLHGEDEALPAESDTASVVDESETVVETSSEGGGAEVAEIDEETTEEASGGADEVETQADETAESDAGAREEVAQETEESIEISDEIESATGVDEAQVIQDEVEAESAQGEEIGERAQEIEEAAVESAETPEDAVLETEPEIQQEETIETPETAEAQDAAQGKEVAMLSPEAKFHMQQGMMYVSLARATPATADENYSNALIEFSNAIRLYPDYTQAYSNRGVIYMHTQKFNLAKRDMQKAADLSPEDPYVQYNLAALYSVSGDLDLSIEALDRSLANGFDNYDALRPEGANSDPDLDNVRQTPEFRQTLEKYKIFIVQ